jgi:hypothetical protein
VSNPKVAYQQEKKMKEYRIETKGNQGLYTFDYQEIRNGNCTARSTPTDEIGRRILEEADRLMTVKGTRSVQITVKSR